MLKNYVSKHKKVRFGFALLSSKCLLIKNIDNLLLKISQNFIIEKNFLWSSLLVIIHRANIYLFKVHNRNTRKRCKIGSKLTIKTPERRQ